MRRVLRLAFLLALVPLVSAHAQVGSGNLLEDQPPLRPLTGPPVAGPTTDDTLWIGHSMSAPPPWHVGTGPNRPGTSPDGLWDWDHFANAESDSLFGWWPIRLPYRNSGGMTLADHDRPWWALDFGNMASYVINQGSPKRTFGVRGIWHRDPGDAVGQGMPWPPIQGQYSAYCILRRHGDNSVIDDAGIGGTGNPFNEDAVQFLPSRGAYPGIPPQSRQFMVRYIVVPSGQDLHLSFDCHVNLPSYRDLEAATRTGYFDRDPFAVVPGNFISSTDAGSNAPVDSFRVFVGRPVNPQSVLYSDGTTRPLHDPRYRWLDEIISTRDTTFSNPILSGIFTNYYDVFSAAGKLAADRGAPPAHVEANVTRQFVEAVGIAVVGGFVLAVVFDVITGHKPENVANASPSAVMVDNVSWNGSPPETFEPANSFAYDPSDPLGIRPNWRAYACAPEIYAHPKPITALRYDDRCGAWNSPMRTCDLSGNVLSMGNADQGEKLGGAAWLSEREIFHGAVSPTIDLRSLDGKLSLAREMGMSFDVYAGGLNTLFSGSGAVYGIQSYPVAAPGGGYPRWSDIRMPKFQLFSPGPRCLHEFVPGFMQNLIETSNEDGLPDSVRIFLGHVTQCFRFSVTLGCNSDDGLYFDNVSFGVVHQEGAPPPAPTLSTDIWEWFQDAFPANETPGLAGTAAFDTCAAQIKTGLNLAQAGASGPRFDIPGDSMVVRAPGPDTRVDLVFRIKPGVGNYVVRGQPSSGLRKVPTSPDAVAVGDASFWGQYLAAPGAFASPGGHAGGTWNPDVWNSARCDTAETNLFPVEAAGNLPGLRPGAWASTYHEADPKLAVLGVARNRCFLVDTLGPATSGNITCSGVPAWATTVPASRTGYDGVQTTREYTKIIPDGLLTPGSHVEYFYRRTSAAAPAAFRTLPDTNRIFPQYAEGAEGDGHRWQEFSILPDRWKDPAFGGLGSACLLFVDLADSRGSERAWVGIADSIGATVAAKWGAHNGWRAPAGYDYTGLDVAGDPAIAVARHGGQPGTTWDMYGVKAAESLTAPAGGIGGRLANRASMAFAFGKQSMVAPTPEMLRTYYRVLLLLSGDLSEGVLGPYPGRSANDVAILEDFMTFGTNVVNPRGVFVQGSGFVESESRSAGLDPAHGTLLSSYLALSLRDPTYASLSGNPADAADLRPTSVVSGGREDVFGLRDDCTRSNDVFTIDPGVPEAAVASLYQDVGVNGPYVAGVWKPSSSARPFITLVDGWDVADLGDRFHDGTTGRLAYYLEVFTNVFASICAISGTPTIDVPNGPRGPHPTDYIALRNNPLASGNATIRFGLARPDRVQVVLYDVGGRRVRTLADRAFAAGEHELAWDGGDDTGRPLARGVYFARVHFQSRGFEDSRRIVLLK